MKQLKTLGIAILALFMFSACTNINHQSQNLTPEQVGKESIQAFFTGDVNKIFSLYAFSEEELQRKDEIKALKMMQAPYLQKFAQITKGQGGIKNIELIKETDESPSPGGSKRKSLLFKITYGKKFSNGEEISKEETVPLIEMPNGWKYDLTKAYHG